jgi:hypothetical protein
MMPEDFDIKIACDLSNEELDAEIDRFRTMGYARDLQKNKPKGKRATKVQKQEALLAELIEKYGGEK